MVLKEEDQPYVKKHNGTSICFADTTTQVTNALKGENLMNGSPDDLRNGHLMMFGVEDWTGPKAKAVAEGFRASNINFERLEIFGCDIKEEAQKALAEGFCPKENKNMGTVTRVDLDNTKLCATGAKAIFEKLAECEKINKINLQGSVPDAGVLSAINDAITANCNLLQSLNHVDLKICDLKEGAGKPIQDLMTKFVQETHLDLFYNSLKTPGAQAIGAALLQNANIVHLDLCCNEIGDNGAKAIAEGITNHTSIKVLKLALNDIGNEGAIAIMAAISPVNYEDRQKGKHNKTITHLDLSANVMKEEIPDSAISKDEQIKDGDAILENIFGDGQAPKNVEEYKGLSNAYDDAEKKEKPKAVVDNRPLKTQIVEMFTGHDKLREFDFTGIEFDENGWNAIGHAMEAVFKEEVGTIKREDTIKPIIKFSIVDLMSKANLEVLEPRIWKTTDQPDKWKFFPALDWRRLPEPAAQPEAAAATN